MTINFSEIDKWLSNYMKVHADDLPSRWQRWLAMYYPDARIRKLFWQKTQVEMGEDTFSNFGMIVSDDYTSGECLLSLGDRVSISPGVVFVPYSMPNNSKKMQEHIYISTKLVKREKIIVEDDVWIGSNATILPGIRIGRGSIIGAGAVVTKNVDPFVIVAGVPAQVISKLEGF